jgi:phenylalanyl-tRNA synthetase beta chain
MNISLNWLSTHLDLAGKSPEDLDSLLTFAGIEVEGIHVKGIASPRIVIAEVKEAVQHPNADRLKVCQVDTGEGSLRQIVCGARNYKVGDKVPCALPGAAMPGGFTIGETKMRGVDSHGMLCSASELGMVDAEDGLMILPADSPTGVPLKDHLGSDVLLEVEVTPNRPDLLSHSGMARELSALLGQQAKPLEIPARDITAAGTFVTLEAPDICPFYSAVKISGVRVTESPAWLKSRLESIGLRPINNIVDITNFVLHETGQPLHAFDAAKLGGDLVIRHAEDGESFLALDEKTYPLLATDLVVADSAGHVLALGGVMGGADSGVTESTTDIVLESAYFSPSPIRRTSRRLILSSDSSYRFERGVDPSGVLAGSALAVKLILELAGGTAGATLVAGEAPQVTSPVTLDLAKLDQLMGSSISHADAESILTRLGLTKLADGTWNIPSHRADLHRHIDLVEEIARVHGLDNVPSRLQAAFVPASDTDAAYDADMSLRRALAALGFNEAQTIKLISESQLADALPLRPLLPGDIIRVSLPLSEDHAVLRPSIIPGLVASAQRNLRQGAKALRFFELGRVFRNAGGGKAKDVESETLGLLLAGSANPPTWSQAERQADIYDIKAVLGALLPSSYIQFTPRERDGFALACDIQADGQGIGVFARLLPSRERTLDATAPIHVAELDLAKIRKLLGGRASVDELPQFPGSSRDAAMELPASTANLQIEQAITKLKEPLLVGFECFDVFRDPSGEKLAADRKSVAYRFHYRASDRTLKTEEIDAAHQKLLDALAKALPLNYR